MKPGLVVLFFLSAVVSPAQNPVLVLDGNYTGKNIYIQNPFNASGDDYCTIEVRVNGKKMLQSVKVSAYEIPLDSFGFKLYDSLHVEIEHYPECTPKVLTYHNGNPRPTFEVTEISVDSSGLLKWKTIKEEGKLFFIIEQFVWNKWIPVGEAGGKGLFSENSYEFQITPHSGKNKVRVKQAGGSGHVEYSSHVEFISNIPPVKLLSKKIKDKIEFSAETRFELYDVYGNIIKKGYLKEVDCSKLKKGGYYLNYDNSDNEKIVKEK
ncbi:MAG: hypothetical protein ACOZCO_04715 [Bacteroidota bacterium]